MCCSKLYEAFWRDASTAEAEFVCVCVWWSINDHSKTVGRKCHSADCQQASCTVIARRRKPIAALRRLAANVACGLTHVQLSDEAGHVGMLKIQRQDVLGKLNLVQDDKAATALMLDQRAYSREEEVRDEISCLTGGLLERS